VRGCQHDDKDEKEEEGLRERSFCFLEEEKAEGVEVYNTRNPTREKRATN